MSYKGTYSNALKNVRKRKSLNFILLFSYSSTVVVSFQKCTHFNTKFHTLKLIKLTNVKFYRNEQSYE